MNNDDYRRLMRDRITVIEPGLHFAGRVVASLPGSSGGMLAWAARRVLPVSLGLAAVLSIVAVLNRGAAEPQTAAVSNPSTSSRAADPLEWLLETPESR